MDPAQKPSEPLKTLEAKELARVVNQPPGVATSAAEDRNREHAAEELSSMWALHKDPHFQWFWRECIQKEYDAARTRYNAEELNADQAREFRAQYLQLRRIMRFMIDREIAHRRLLNPNDADIPLLQQRLSLL